MKTIFYEQNQLSISKKNKTDFKTVYINPKPETMEQIAHKLLKTKNFKAVVVDEKGTFFKQFKRDFLYIKAAGGLVINSKGEILLIKRLGFWDLPKGKLEKGESKNEGAMREVEEECGISRLAVVKPIKPSYHIYSQKGKWILKKSFWFIMKYDGSEELKPQTEENITEVKWINRNDLPNYRTQMYPAIAKVLRQLPPL